LLVELLQRIGAPRLNSGSLESSFTLCVVNTNENLRVFLDTPVSPETLLRFYGVRKSSYS